MPTIITVFDTIVDLVTVVTPAWPTTEFSAEQPYEAGLSRLGRVLDDFDKSLPRHGSDPIRQFGEPQFNMTVA